MTTFHRAHKIELIVDERQATYFKKACGCARFAYNWALAQWKADYAAYKANPMLEKPSQFSIRKKLNAIKRQAFPWMLEVTKCAPQLAIIQLGKSFANFWRNPEHFKYPKFKKKFVDDSFTISNDHFKVEGSRISIPKLGWVSMRESLRFENAKLLSATVSRHGKRWYVSLSCELENLNHLKAAENQGTVGVDLGIKSLAVLSNHKHVEAPKPYITMMKKLKREQRKLARCQLGSHNREKQRLKVAEVHRRIFNIRQNSLHQLTHYLTSHFSRIVIEDLNVRGMLKNHHLSQRIADIGFYEFRRQLQYKCQQRGCELIVVDRFYPSSKTCGYCGCKNESLTLSDRHWQCPHCQKLIADRDFNAAINLKNYQSEHRG